MSSHPSVILLVDDEPWLTQALLFSLEAAEFECVVATDLSEAMQIMRSRTVRAVVTDIMMPGGADYPEVDSSDAGFHFIKLVRSGWRDVPIVCLSVIGDQKKINSLTRQGIRYLRKGETPLSTAVEVVTAVATGRRIRL
jgi:DNA-binding response OmpR family regulator